MVKSKGRMPSLVKLFALTLKTTLIITMPGGKRITVHTDGTISRTSDKISSILNRSE